MWSAPVGRPSYSRMEGDETEHEGPLGVEHVADDFAVGIESEWGCVLRIAQELLGGNPDG